LAATAAHLLSSLRASSTPVTFASRR
jgi:hypothetical protein